MTAGPRSLLPKSYRVTSKEVFQTLIRQPHFLLERIVSSGQTTPPGTWLEQKKDEWVVLLQGRAALRMGKKNTLLRLKPGDALLIPAGVPHRVEWTDPHNNTVWLALHY